MSDPTPVARCGGFRCLLIALTDNLQDLSDALLQVFLYMLEAPETRKYIRQGLDSEMVMSGFTDIYSHGNSYSDRVRASGRIITAMIRSWAGLFDLCANEKRAIRSLVESLRLPIQENRSLLLDIFYDIFRINTPKWLVEYLQGKAVKPKEEELEEYWKAHKEMFGLVDHHQSVVLTVFLEAGLMEALISLIENGGRNPKLGDHDGQIVVRKAIFLISELMQLSARVLPTAKSIQIHSLAQLFTLATNFQDPVLRHVATEAFWFIDMISRSESGFKPERQEAHEGQVDRAKMRAASQVDEVEFRTMLLDSQVLQTKDVSKWRWPKILEIIQGPLLNPRRLDDAVRSTKFMKRLLAFYRPLNRRYSSEKLANEEGTKFLMHNKILRLIAEGLTQLVPVHGHPGSDPIFSRERMESTMTSGYFEMLGTLCKSYTGLKLLEKFKIFDSYYRLSELRSRDDVVKKIITSMDYQLDGHPRVILSKIMTSGYKHIRLTATQHLGNVLRTANHEFSDWGIRLLTTQLYDPSMDVCQMAVKCLDDACSHPKNLDLLIRLRPNLDHLGDAGSPLLLRFLSTSRGFHHLHEMSYIESQMDDWFMNINRSYMIQTEIRLAKAMELSRFNPFSADGKFDNDAELQMQRARQVILPHFYGELTRTEEGCHLLRMKGHFEKYARFIREHCAEHKDPAIISQLKSVLWAVGNVGSTVGGLPFLEEEDLFKYIVGMAERSKVHSLKGTCFYVLGLLCKTEQGIEILEDYDWEGIMGDDKVPRGLCLPKRLDQFLDVPSWERIQVPIPALDVPLTREGNAVEKEILKYIGELSNHILTSGASKALQKIKAEQPTYFSSLTLYSAIMQMLGHYHYRLPVRRFILGLFDVRLEGSAILERLDQLGHVVSDVSKNAKGTTSSTPNLMHPNKRSASTGALTGIIGQLAGGGATGSSQTGNSNNNNNNNNSGSMSSTPTASDQGRSRRSVTMPSSIMAPRKSLDGGGESAATTTTTMRKSTTSSTTGVAYPVPPSPTQAQHPRTTERKLMQPPLPIITSSLLQSSNRFHGAHANSNNGNGSSSANNNSNNNGSGSGGRGSPVTMSATEIGPPLVHNTPMRGGPAGTSTNNPLGNGINHSNGTATVTIASLSKALRDIDIQKGGNGSGRNRGGGGGMTPRISFESPIMPLSPTDGLPGPSSSPPPPELAMADRVANNEDASFAAAAAADIISPLASPLLPPPQLPSSSGGGFIQRPARRQQHLHGKEGSSDSLRETDSTNNTNNGANSPSRPDSRASSLMEPVTPPPLTLTSTTTTQTPAALVIATPAPAPADAGARAGTGAGADSVPDSPMRPPPIPPPRPPTHAYEILYTNKPYHKNFAREAKLEPLPPRVKVRLDFDEDVQ
ncbi:hypothetical protein DFQ27_001208 [Actinomortierella ambigua]|uniref:Uncharacterized protein n=1 Tax=Actinomortierella ambigua TaxID=1343610 RepID=A0A9P6QD46_9FUNG|nr:hypothetical protein DFQ27_001208 [Actinomortierella ambigua]